MSSYGSLSPSDESYERYETSYYCTPHAYHGNPMEGVCWQTSVDQQESEHDIYTDNGHYIGRSYGYDEVQMTNEAFDNYHSIHHTYPPNTGLDCEIQSSVQLRGYERATPPSFVRVVKRRNTANKKERRRTQSINTAFSDLRDCIPNVPADTKLSKIKTLRLATSYISYLMRVLETDGEPAGGFRADLQHPAPRKRHHDNQGMSASSESKRGKGRTGWPQHVWALELSHEQNLQT